VEVLLRRAHAADVEGEHPLDRQQRLLEVVVHDDRHRARDLEARLPAASESA
jgi:hypothetical protein